MDRIAEHYGAKTAFSKGFQTNNGVTRNDFTITVSDSKMLDSLRQDITGPNIALMMYGSLEPDERIKYDIIRVEFAMPSAQEPKTYGYEREMLEPALDQSSIYHNFSDNLLNGDYKGISDAVVPKFRTPGLRDNLSKFIENLEKLHGKLKGYKRTGFGFYNLSDGRKLYHFTGYLNFADGHGQEYYVTVSTDTDDDYIQGFDLEF